MFYNFKAFSLPSFILPYYFTEINTWSFAVIWGQVVSLVVSLPIVIKKKKVSVGVMRYDVYLFLGNKSGTVQ